MTVTQFLMKQKVMLERYFGDGKMRQILKAYADIAKEERQRGIEMQQSPDGSRFTRLKAKTVRAKQRKGSLSPSKALIDKGYLKNPVTKADAKAGRVIPPKSRKTIIQYHEYAGRSLKSRRKRTLPARPNWGIYPEAERRITRLWKKHLANFVKELARG